MHTNRVDFEGYSHFKLTLHWLDARLGGHTALFSPPDYLTLRPLKKYSKLRNKLSQIMA